MCVVWGCVQWVSMNGTAVSLMGVICVGLFSGLYVSGFAWFAFIFTFLAI